MGKSDLMDRVATDLAHGHTHPAIQRMHSLVAAHPTDLDLRRRLASIYRAVGNAVEAGRWSYLEYDAEPAETKAFESAYPSPARRRAALRWPAQAPPPTEFARDRLDNLPAPVAVRTSATERTRKWRTAGYGALGALALIGAYSIIEWLFG